jgi:hypothetical protein
VFRRDSSTPSTPSGGSYNFGTNTLTPPTGWSTSVPSGSLPLYTSTSLASIQGVTGIDSSLSWTTPVILAKDGADGADGADGQRGAGRFNIGVTTLPTTSSGAHTDFTNAIGDPVDRDQAWFYTGTLGSPTAQSVWIYEEGSGATPATSWNYQENVMVGDLLVDGTISAAKFEAQSISALGMTIGTLASAPSGERVVISDTQILVYDSNNIVRVKIGNLA